MKTILKISVLLPVLVLGLLIFNGCSEDTASSGPTPPACSIVYPSDGQSVTDTVMVEIHAEDNIAVTQVLLYIDGALVYETIVPPYQYSWNTRVYPDSSQHELYAIAWNQDSLSSVSDTVNVLVDFQAGSGQNVLVVANQNSGTLSLIDLYALGAVERDVIGVGTVPNDIIFANGRLHVINSMSHDMNVISLAYSGEMVQVVSPIDLGINLNRNPQYGSIAANGYLYISNGMTDDITVFDLEALTSRIRSDVGVAPAGILAAGGKVYVCNTGFNFNDYTYGMGSVSVIDTLNNMETTKIEMGEGRNPQFMALDPSGKIHVVCTGNYNDVPGEIQVIDPLTDEVVSYVYIGGTPGDIAINSEGMAYIAAGGWGSDPGRVFRYNAATGQILNGPDNPIMTATGAMRVVAASDNSIYVACFNAGTVDKIREGVRVESYTVGDGPAAMVIVER